VCNTEAAKIPTNKESVQLAIRYLYKAIPEFAITYRYSKNQLKSRWVGVYITDGKLPIRGW